MKSGQQPKHMAVLQQSGFGQAKYLVMKRRDESGQPDNRATMTFSAQRSGLASWLAAPSGMGSLNFISPDATVVAAATMKIRYRTQTTIPIRPCRVKCRVRYGRYVALEVSVSQILTSPTRAGLAPSCRGWRPSGARAVVPSPDTGIASAGRRRTRRRPSRR